MVTKGTKYYWEHREQCLEVRRKYAEGHKEKQKEYAAKYYQKTLKQRRRIDRMYAQAELPPKPPKPAPRIKTVKKFLAAAPVPKNPRKPRAPKKHPDLSTLADMMIPSPSVGVQFLPGVTLDWNKL